MDGYMGVTVSNFEKSAMDLKLATMVEHGKEKVLSILP